MNDLPSGIEARGSSRIMIIDDTPANLTLLKEMLHMNGKEVVAFPSGAMALKAAEKNPPDVILLDINMPEMDGYQVCGHLKQNPRLKDIPVIFLSALDSTRDKVKAFQAGAADYIAKPFKFREVQHCVDTQLKLSAMQRKLAEIHSPLQAIAAQLKLAVDGINGGKEVGLFLDSLQNALASVEHLVEITDKVTEGYDGNERQE